MKLLFLDIDGVLATRQELMKGLLEDRSHDFNPDAINYLNRLCKETDCSIVISSTWRLGKDIDALRKIFLRRGFVYPEKIIGKTLSWLAGPRDHEFSRGEEIEVYLHEATMQAIIQTYCIVDDDSDMLVHQLPYFVKTEFETGLQKEHYEKIIEILGRS